METAEVHTTDIQIPIGDIALNGSLALPEQATGLVVFAHGSGSSRFSSRNRYVAQYLNEAGLGTLLFDLLTAEENEIDQFTRQYRFDIHRLAERLVGAIDWLKWFPPARALNIGLYGASTGAAAALIAAAKRPQHIAAVVSRGGRPDLASTSLPAVKSPTLLLVGGNDHQVIELNQQAVTQMRNNPTLTIIPGASHLFEEDGKLDEVTRHALKWFQSHL